MVDVGYFAAQHMSRGLEHTVTSVSKICAMNDFGMLSEFDEPFVRMMCLCIRTYTERMGLLRAISNNEMVTNFMRAAMSHSIYI